MLPVANKETMSHIEIAKLVQSRPDSVKRTIERLSESGVISYTPSVGGKSANGVTITNYNVNERDSYIVVAQLSPEFTAALVDEWNALKNKQQSLPNFNNPAEAARAWADRAEAEQKALIERDHAIATKAQINDKRTATLMNKASQDSKRIKKLESQLQDEGTHRSMLAEKIPTYIYVLGKRKSVATILKNISDDMELPRQKVACKRYGSVWAYHVDVIAQFKDMYL